MASKSDQKASETAGQKTSEASNGTRAIDAGAQYAVHLAEPVEVLGERLYPGREYRLRGDVLIQIEANVLDASQLR